VNPQVDIAAKVASLASRAQELLRSSGPEANAGVVSWIKDVEAAGALVKNGAISQLGPHAASADNLRLAARVAVERLLQMPWVAPETRAVLAGYLERNPAARQVGKYRFSSDWMSKCEAEWRTTLAPLAGKADVRALEIGSFEGRSAIWLLENVLTHATSHMTCVDLFKGDYSKLFDENIAASGAAGRVEKLTGASSVILRRMAPEPTFDFIYVDGSHQTYDTLEDAVLSWRLLRPGGWMIFDDYGMATQQLTPHSRLPRPDIGIDAFLLAAADELQVVQKGFQVTVRKNPA
jgi:predicted O-methyltransferase YrrM